MLFCILLPCVKGLVSSDSESIYLAALMNLRIILGSPDRKDQSSLFLLKRLQSGTQRVQACGNKSKNSVCLPITPSSLSQLHTSRESTGHPDRLRFVGCGCFMLCRFLSLRRAALNPRLTVCAVIG